jgi:hypothetical protein
VVVLLAADWVDILEAEVQQADNLLLVHLLQHQEQTEQLVNQELQTTDAQQLQQHQLHRGTETEHITVEQVVRVAMVGFQLVIKRKK